MTVDLKKQEALKLKIQKQQKERIARAYSKELDAKCTMIERKLDIIDEQGNQLTEVLNTAIEANQKLVDVLLDNMDTKKIKGESTQQMIRRLEKRK